MLFCNASYTAEISFCTLLLKGQEPLSSFSPAHRRHVEMPGVLLPGGLAIDESFCQAKA